MIDLALLALLVSLFAAVVGAPLALLAPVFAAVVVDVPEDVYSPAVVSEARGGVLSPRTIETAAAAPFVAVYAARGESRPAVHPWSLCAERPLALHVDRNAMPLRGAARRASIAKAARKACTSHACPTVARKPGKVAP